LIVWAEAAAAPKGSQDGTVQPFGRYRVRVRDDRHIPVARVPRCRIDGRVAAPRSFSVAEIDALAEPFEIRTDDVP
jgi:hypothetical protein